jgi:hypothetical protein
MKWQTFDVAIAVLMWAAVLRIIREDRLRLAISEAERRSRWLIGAAAVSATVGVTSLMVWFITDRMARVWVHDLSEVATVAFIATAVLLAGYGGWIKGH